MVPLAAARQSRLFSGAMATVSIERLAGDEYRVTVTEGASTTVHRVRVTEEDRASYGGGTPAEALLEESLRYQGTPLRVRLKDRPP